MLHRLAIGLVLAAISPPSLGAEWTSNVQPPPFETPYCVQGDKLVCDYVLFDTSGNSSGTLPLYQVGQQVPSIRSVELRSLASAPGTTGGRVYVLVFTYVTPQDLPAPDL
jgi:hypothetical protein